MDKEKFFAGSWNSSNFGMEDLNCSSEQLTNSFFNPNWENSVDQSDPFESALSSIVSSPVNSNAGGENIVLRELIGRLGSICNSNEISNDTYINLNNSTNTSCYTTPLNSPPKLSNLSAMDHQIRGNLQIPNWAPFHTDPGFVERAAKFSSLGGKVFGDSVEESSVSEQIPGKIESVTNAQTDSSGRKRKSIPKGKGKEIPSPTIVDTKVDENEDSDAKRSKSDEKKSVEPPKDYIHVRARRGQATDSHSLAERVRREKIGERMKFLQDLVPGCNKVTGKAVMLDEIINYVQSLQCQVEFLSMKLSTVSPRAESTMESLLTKDMYESNGSVHHSMYRPDSSGVHNFPHGYHSNGSASTFSVNHCLSSAIRQNSSLQVSQMDGFGESAASQVPTFWEDDLQSFVQMGFVQNDTQSLQGKIATSQMKVEL